MIKTTRNCDYTNKLKNVLDRDFSPDSPNACWCTDITYIWTYDDGFVYLTSIMDFYSRKIISWTLSKTMELKCLEIAKQRRKTENAIVIQSDRGCAICIEEVSIIDRGHDKKLFPQRKSVGEGMHRIFPCLNKKGKVEAL